MSKEALVFTLGIVVSATSFLGIPREYKEWIFIASGILLTITGYRLRRRSFLASLERETGERHSDAFVESVGTSHPETNEAEHRDRVL